MTKKTTAMAFPGQVRLAPGGGRHTLLTIKVTADEKHQIMAVANARSLNLSALVRRLLFAELGLADESRGT